MWRKRRAWLVLLRCWLSSKLCDYKQLDVSRALLSRERLPVDCELQWSVMFLGMSNGGVVYMGDENHSLLGLPRI